MENVAGEQDLTLQQHFPYKTSNFFPKIQTYCFIPRGSNLATLVFRCTFSIQVIAHIYYKNYNIKIL